ncbi:MAG: hypothetical protein ACFFDH_24235 [Promethearchaeota archaeon]
MIEKKHVSLKEKIIEEMTVDYSDALDRNFNLAKNYIKITKNGKIEVLYKQELTGAEQILLYLIGKVYAKEAELASTHEVDTQELMEELGIIKGSFYPSIKRLRDKKKIIQVKKGKLVYFSVPSNHIEKILNKIASKLKNKK